MKTRPTLLLNLSEQQAATLGRCAGPLPVLLATLDPAEQRRVQALHGRGLLHLISITASDYMATLSAFGYASLHAYSAAQAAGLLKDVA